MKRQVSHILNGKEIIIYDLDVDCITTLFEYGYRFKDNTITMIDGGVELVLNFKFDLKNFSFFNIPNIYANCANNCTFDECSVVIKNINYCDIKCSNIYSNAILNCNIDDSYIDTIRLSSVNHTNCDIVIRPTTNPDEYGSFIEYVNYRKNKIKIYFNQDFYLSVYYADNYEVGFLRGVIIYKIKNEVDNYIEYSNSTIQHLTRSGKYEYMQIRNQLYVFENKRLIYILRNCTYGYPDKLKDNSFKWFLLKMKFTNKIKI